MLIYYTTLVVVQSIAFKAKIRKPYHDISFYCNFCIKYSVTVKQIGIKHIKTDK